MTPSQIDELQKDLTFFGDALISGFKQLGISVAMSPANPQQSIVTIPETAPPPPNIERLIRVLSSRVTTLEHNAETDRQRREELEQRLTRAEKVADDLAEKAGYVIFDLPGDPKGYELRKIPPHIRRVLEEADHQLAEPEDAAPRILERLGEEQRRSEGQHEGTQWAPPRESEQPPTVPQSLQANHKDLALRRPPEQQRQPGECPACGRLNANKRSLFCGYCGNSMTGG